MKKQLITIAAAVAAVMLAAILLRRGNHAAISPESPPAATAPAQKTPLPAGAAGAVPGSQPMIPVKQDEELQLSEEERRRLIEFEKSIDMIDTPSGKRPRRPF